ncbi:MAG: low molecular weight phosphotyrosine protein phosphatase [Spirochaetaceae bacterium]
MFKIVFVCLGNICRSPSAEGIFKKLIIDHNLQNDIYIDSAGTSAYHVGERSDSRMRQHAYKRGYQLTSLSRRFVHKDFNDFDLIIVMDQSNFTDVKNIDIDGDYSDKIMMMTSFSTNYSNTDVPDPYYGGPDGFDNVITILEESCLGLLEYLKSNDKL